MNRNNNWQKIQQLDPQKDCSEICHLIVGYEFPWDITKSLEIGLLRTFCIPSIAKLLEHTGEFQHRAQKRYDDTGLIMAEIMKWGYNSARGKATLERLNRIHGHFSISNEDYLFVLSTFIFDPIRWIEQYGGRPLCQKEKLAFYYFWCAVGSQMHIQNIPSTYEEFDGYNREYVSQKMRYSKPNKIVANATLKLLLSWYPTVLNPLIKPAVLAILDDVMLDALGWEHPSPQSRQFIEAILKLRGRLLRMLPAHRVPQFFTDLPSLSYPQGYELKDLGPPSLLDKLNTVEPQRKPNVHSDSF